MKNKYITQKPSVFQVTVSLLKPKVQRLAMERITTSDRKKWLSTTRSSESWREVNKNKVELKEKTKIILIGRGSQIIRIHPFVILYYPV